MGDGKASSADRIRGFGAGEQIKVSWEGL